MSQKKFQRIEKQTMLICFRIHKGDFSRRRGWPSVLNIGEDRTDRLRVNNSSLVMFPDRRYRRRMKWQHKWVKEHKEKELSACEKYLQIVHEIVEVIWRPLTKSMKSLYTGFVGEFMCGHLLFTRRLQENSIFVSSHWHLGILHLLKTWFACFCSFHNLLDHTKLSKPGTVTSKLSVMFISPQGPPGTDCKFFSSRLSMNSVREFRKGKRGLRAATLELR